MQTKDKSTSEEFPKRLTVVKIIGYGTGVTIYRVKKTHTSETLALKVVNKSFKRARYVSERLLKEANILREVEHPNIVGYMGHVISPEGCLLLLEELDQSLGDYIEKLHDTGSESLRPTDICQVLCGVCRALDYLHTEKYLLHGDVKSHNILIKESDKKVKLCDFGLSVRLGPDGNADVEEYVGTLCWAPPEALGAGPLSPKVDIFSLGMVVYEMLTLKVPYFHYCRVQNGTYITDKDNAGLDAVNENPQSLEERPELPQDVEYRSFIEIFSWCTEADFRVRPSARELLQVLVSREFATLRPQEPEALVTTYRNCFC